MARAASNPRDDSAQDLTDAFHVHSALVTIEAKRPHLRNNPRWQIIRQDAYEAFYLGMVNA